MKSVISVVGRDAVGIIAKVSSECAECGVNILDISQTVMEEYFTMIMLVDIDKLNCSLDEMKNHIEAAVPEMKVHVMHEDIFNSMHRI